MNCKKLFTPLITVLITGNCTFALAKVTPEEAAKLGNELTCAGAEAAGNKEGTIPPFSGKWVGTPPDIHYIPHVGQHPVDPYPDDKPLFVINGQNWKNYSEQLTPGQIKMFERYSGTFEMPVYQGRRDFDYPAEICDIMKKNAVNAELIDDGFGFTGLKGAVPFPIPDVNQPLQVLANHNFPYRAYTYRSVRDVADVDSAGKISWGRQINSGYNLPNSPEELGQPVGGMMAYGLTVTDLPVRDKGSATVSAEPVNFARDKRLAWNYNPGTRRVRQLPEYGFDTPLAATSGKLTIDSDRLMNGSPERYEWSLKGKKEIFIPANAYRIQSNTVKYDDLLQVGHANPKFMRYELRRVWVLEGKLKEGYRHKYGKRTLYLDEDNWHAVVSDFYDTRDELVQYAFINYYYAFDADSWEAGSSFYHDLTTGGYVGYNLYQERALGVVLNEGGYTKDMFSPAALRRLSH